MKKKLLGSTLAAIAVGWIVIPFCQAQPGAMPEECTQSDCEVTPLAEPIDPMGFCAPLTADDCGPVLSVRPGLAQSGNRATSTQVNSPVKSAIFQSVRDAEAPNFNSEPAPATRPARSNQQFVATRKHGREMDDREMDGTCGGITGSFDMTQSGNLTLNDNSVTTLSLSGQAQQNLSSMVNIISIESTISVMLNLNVNINSTVGTVNQGNTGTQNTGVQNTLVTGHP